MRTDVEGEANERVRLSAAARKAIEDMGHRPVASISRSDLLRVVDAIKRGTADQLMVVVSCFYNDRFDRGVEILNPARNRLRVTGGRCVRSRTLTDQEFLTIWRALEGGCDPAVGAFALLAFAGARRWEVTQMPWSEIDLDGATWTLPPERRKSGRRDPDPFVIHLHSEVVVWRGRELLHPMRCPLSPGAHVGA